MDFDTNGNGMAVSGGDSGTAISGGTGGFSNSYNTVFAGNGHIISHLYIYIGGSNGHGGLFGYTGSNAVLRNVGVKDAAVSGVLSTSISPA